MHPAHKWHTDFSVAGLAAKPPSGDVLSASIDFFIGVIHGRVFGLSALDFEDPRAMLELVAGVQFGVVRRAGLPHFPEDFQPALAQASQRAGVTLSSRAQLVVVNSRPRTVPAT